jgi:hypothetical protein
VGIRPGLRALLTALVVIAVVLVVGAGALFGAHAYITRDSDETLAAAEREIRDQAGAGSWDEAKQALDRQAAALVRGDEQGWLAAVDPANARLREQYRGMYANLRALGVSAWSYHVRIPAVTRYGRPELETDTTVAFCLHTASCPAFDPARSASGQPVSTVDQHLSMTRRDGAYVITALEPVEGQLTMPWQGRLTFAQGKRVTVAAPPSQAGRLAEAVAAADRAAVVADRYARFVGNPQQRYRVYLAGEAEWRTWFGGAPRRNAIGYAIPVGIAATEVVLRMDELRGAGLQETARHELGHVVTLSGSDQRYAAVYDVHEWLVEGVAEYIGHVPEPPTASRRQPLIDGAKRLPASLAMPPLTDDSPPDEVNRFYGLGHHAVSCLADRFGERAFFGFFTRVLREGASYAEASRAAFRRPWKEVDRACVAAIRRSAR